MLEKKYTDEVRARAIDRVVQRRRDEPHNRSIVREVAEEFDVGAQSLRQWLARYDDGSYDYADGDTPARARAVAGRSRQGQQQLITRIAELEQLVAVLRDDNRSLTRVVALLAEELRTSLVSAGGREPQQGDD